MERRLASWKGRKLSLAGRITLRNSVVNSLPIYFMSLLRVLVKVLKTLINIPRKFLWSGSQEKMKIAWVRWDSLCKPKEDGGLRIKNLDWFNFIFTS